MKRFHSSYAIRSWFYLSLIRVNSNESRKDKEVEGSNQHHAKALRERLTSGAGWPRIDRPACTCGQSPWPFCRRAGSVHSVPGMFPWPIWWKMKAGRPGLGRPAWIHFGVRSNSSGMLVLFSLFEITAHSAKDQNRGVVGTYMCTNHKSTKRNDSLFLFYSKQRGVLLHTID